MTHLHSHSLYVCNIIVCNCNITQSHIRQARHPLLCKFQPESIFNVTFLYADNLEKCEIELQPNKAYETVTRPCPSRHTLQVPVELCPDYEALDH